MTINAEVTRNDLSVAIDDVVERLQALTEAMEDAGTDLEESQRLEDENAELEDTIEYLRRFMNELGIDIDYRYSVDDVNRIKKAVFEAMK